MSGMRVLCTGSFDPVTVGHCDYICRAAALFGSVVVVVAANAEKRCMFSAEERVRFLRQAFAGFENVEVVADGGWAADLAAKYGADCIVKGVRNGADVDYEDVVSAANREVSGVETLYIPCSPEFSRVSSTAVRDMIRHGKDCGAFIPKGVTIGREQPEQPEQREQCEQPEQCEQREE